MALTSALALGWSGALDSVERFPLARLPTPLARATRLERVLGSPPIFIKRDDLTGFALAGNKARKLEFLLGDALSLGADVLITGGGPGSNHCQGSAAAARVAGLRCVLAMYGEEPSSTHPNLALDRLFGAKISFTGDPDRASVDRAIEEAAREARDRGELPYVVPRGGATARGATSYALAVKELALQLSEQEVYPEVLLVATGSGGTQAGLVAGTVAAGRSWRVVGASVSRPVEEARNQVLRLAQECASLYGWPAVEPRDVELVDARGPGYGRSSPEALNAMAVLADAEGLLLDPVFTAKAFAELLRLVPSLSGPAVFLHTGGTAAALLAAMTGGER